MNSKLLTTAATLALVAGIGAASAQQGAQQERTPNAAPSQAQSGQMKEPESRSHDGTKQQSQAQPERGEKPAPNAGPARVETQDSEKKAQQGARENNQRQGQNGSTATQRQGQTQDTKKSGQAQSESKPGGSDKAAASVELNSDQRTKISQTVKTQNVKRVANVNFNISVGTVVPRNYSFYPVPAPVVAVVPAYRGYLYLVVGDQMLIIHPRTHEIVAVIAV